MGRRVLSQVARGSGCPTATRWRCVGPAAASQAAHDEIERQLDAGEPLSLEAFGDWKPTVPKGMVGVKFVSRAGVFHRLMPEADYPNQRVAPFRGTDNLRVQVLDTYFGRLRRPSNLLASQRLVTKAGSDSFVEQPNSRISTA